MEKYENFKLDAYLGSSSDLFNNDNYIHNPGIKPGGKKSECKNLKNISQNSTEQRNPRIGVGMVQRTYDVKQILSVEKSKNNVPQIDETKLLFNPRIHLKQNMGFNGLTEEFLFWWTETKNYAESTGKEHIRSLHRMAEHSKFPVNWFDLSNQIEQIINQLQYLDRYEYKETRKQTDNPYYGRYQINNFLKAIDAFGRATGNPGLRKLITPYLNLKKTPKPKQPNLPPPHVVNKLIHHNNYTYDKIVNAEIKTILNLGFAIGPRPEEIINMKLSYVRHKTCEVKKREDKVGNVENWVDVEHGVLNSHQQPSVKTNWIDLHRKNLMKRLGISEEEDEGLLFPNPRTGKRFTTSSTFNQWLCGYVKPVLKGLFPEENYDFYPKIMRTWCGTGTLVLTKVKSGKDKGTWDIRAVKNRLGHDSESDVSEDYVRLADKLYKKYPFDWFKAVLKYHPNSKRMKKLMKGENGESHDKNASKSINAQNTPTEIKLTGGAVSAPAGIRTRVAGYLQVNGPAKGQNDWPDYTTGATALSRFELLTLAPKARMLPLHHRAITV